MKISPFDQIEDRLYTSQETCALFGLEPKANYFGKRWKYILADHGLYPVKFKGKKGSLRFTKDYIIKYYDILKKQTEKDY